MSKTGKVVVCGGFHEAGQREVGISLDSEGGVTITKSAALQIKKHIFCGKKTCQCFSLTGFRVFTVPDENDRQSEFENLAQPLLAAVRDHFNPLYN